MKNANGQNFLNFVGGLNKGLYGISFRFGRFQIEILAIFSRIDQGKISKEIGGKM